LVSGIANAVRFTSASFMVAPMGKIWIKHLGRGDDATLRRGVVNRQAFPFDCR
jgi:hypothetical protein